MSIVIGLRPGAADLGIPPHPLPSPPPPRFFQVFLNREIDFYTKNRFFDQKSILQIFIKF